MYEKLRAFLERYVQLNSVEWEVFKRLGKVRRFSKGEVIHRAGEVCRSVYFVNSGLLRAYIINERGQDYTWHIFFNNDKAIQSNLLVVDYESFIHATPSKMSIEVLEDCELIEFSKRSVDFLFSFSKTGCRLGLLLSQEAYGILHNYIIYFATEDAKSRFEFFMSHSAHWFDLVPQHMIATHLGIRPQSLSRLKRAHKGAQTY